jgi:glycosyltransferase involved in cell wall biosynthesis
MQLPHYPTAHLLLAGFVIPAERSHFEALVAKYNLNQKVILTGRISRHEVLYYIRAMDIFAFTSLHDGCLNTVLEAMLAVTSIVATCVGAVPQLIENGKHGLLVQPGLATELSEAMLKLLNYKDRQEYGNQTQHRAFTEFALHTELAAY